MKSPDHYRTQARLCRRDALALAVFAAACAIALGLIGFDLKGTLFWWLPLALISGAAVAATWALLELAEARHHDRLGHQEDTFQPLERI